MKKVGILISGRGSNMVSLIEAMQAHGSPAQPALVISNIKSAGGLVKAESMGVKTLVIDHKLSATREEHDSKMIAALKAEGVEIVCLAGYMRLLSPVFISAFRNSILNIHPALLPSFPGLDVQKKAIDAGARFSGCTVHIVDELCDHGPILLQAVVPILESDDETALAQRILGFEHKVYPLALKLFAGGNFEIRGPRAVLKLNGEEYNAILKDLIWQGDE
jgi:phosphoribosylglycinamide formyltransferase 1